MSKRNIGIPQKRINPVLAGMATYQRDRKLIGASMVANKLITLTVLHDKFGYGKKRLQRFIDEYQDVLDSYNKGYVNVDDLKSVLREECGIEI